MHDGGPNPKLITCGTALGAHTSQYIALFPSSKLISIPFYPVNEAESNHISQASGISYKSLPFIVYFHHHPKLAGQRALISIKAFDCPTQQSVLLSCMMPAVMYNSMSMGVCVCVCVVNERIKNHEQSSAYAKKHMCINCLSPHRLFQPYCLKMNLVSHYTSLWSLPFDVALCSTILWTGQFTLALKIGCFFKDTSPCD